MAKKKSINVKNLFSDIKNKIINGRKLGIYYRVYEKKALDERMILIESKNGQDLAGNMFAIIKELEKQEYRDFCIYLVVQKETKETISGFLSSKHLNFVKTVCNGTAKYYKLLATAKYLFLDTSFAREYMKKEGQVITNTWHGTPLKLMGKDVTNRVYAMGNVQRNLQMADYLVYPNRYMKETMMKAYCLDNLYNGTVLCSGYPRNSVFFDREKETAVRKALGYEKKKVFVYMPTWRGTLTDLKSASQVAELEYLLGRLDRKMDDHLLILAKLHPFVKDGLDFSKFKHIISFPDGYETYELLNAADGLITDYSSVFFDYANKKKKIILWAYDIEAYLGERGVYTDIRKMPFPIVKGIDGLLEEMKKGKEYDESGFLKEYGYYDNPDAAEYICKRVLFGEKLCKEEKAKHNGKDNVFFYVSTLAKNGITTSILSLLSHMDLSDRNYFAVFREKSFAANPMRIEVLPEEFGVWPISAEPKLSLLDLLADYLYYNRNKNGAWIQKRMDQIYRHENIRHFVDVPVNYAVHFTGYEKNIIQMFERLDAERSIFVHNDMKQELATKDNQHRLTLKRAYSSYDHVCIVSEDLRKSTKDLGATDVNLLLTPNCFSYEEVLEKGKQPVELQAQTMLNVEPEVLFQALESDAVKFINIGRFSGEKGHMMLMEAFDVYHEEHPNTKLIIIGGYGKLYSETVQFASECKASNDIIIIRQVENPMPILKRCDLFLLSSFYEGFGLVLLEADALGVPVVSTDVTGPSGFMREHGGYMVKPTKEGLVQAMNAYAAGEIRSITVDYEQYNKNAAAQFEKVIGKG
ncbi:MAG: glycosyltransferase [Eubacterium sp.]|nr:glycosyltransferase [Eubacterium sp.]